MNRLAATVAFASLLTAATETMAQSWIFAPGPYSQQRLAGDPVAQTPQFPVSAAQISPQSAGPEPRAYATFTESQAAQAASLPRPAFRWDPTGVLGRGYRYEMWSHQEAMEANRMRTYAQGVRDAVGSRPIWSWHPPAPVIAAPPPGLALPPPAARQP